MILLGGWLAFATDILSFCCQIQIQFTKNTCFTYTSFIHFLHIFHSTPPIQTQAGIWMNSGDQAGSVMAALVWILMLYSAVTVTSLTITEGIPPILGMIYTLLVSLALSCHAKTSLTDPGSVPKNAVPLESQRRDSTSHAMCGQCQTFKPPMSHHCRICNRCVSRMDHHCPWMNNCVGAGNLSEFYLSGCICFVFIVLFLISLSFFFHSTQNISSCF